MRHAIFAAALLLAACGNSTRSAQDNEAGTVAIPADESVTAENVENELIDNPNGTQSLRLEGNDTATFVGGELVDVNRAD